MIFDIVHFLSSKWCNFNCEQDHTQTRAYSNNVLSLLNTWFCFMLSWSWGARTDKRRLSPHDMIITALLLASEIAVMEHCLLSFLNRAVKCLHFNPFPSSPMLTMTSLQLECGQSVSNWSLIPAKIKTNCYQRNYLVLLLRLQFCFESLVIIFWHHFWLRNKHIATTWGGTSVV